MELFGAGGGRKILNSEYTAFSTLREKKKRWECVAVSVEWEISLTTYTSATITVLDCCTNNGFLGRVKYVWNEIKNNKNLLFATIRYIHYLKNGRGLSYPSIWKIQYENRGE